MKTPVTLALAAGLMFASGAYAATTDTMTADNPFFQPSTLPYELPPFDRIHDADFAPAFVAGMAEQRREIDAIANSPEAPGFDNTIVALEKSGRLLARVSSVFFNLTSSNTNDTLEKLQAEFAPQLAAHRDAIFLNPRLYARIQALYNTRRLLDLDAESLRLLERYHTDFVRAGAQLSEVQKDELRKINEALSKLDTQFEQNLLKDTNASAVVVDTRAELDGLSGEEIAAAAEAAKARGLDGKFVITLMNTTGQPPLTSLTNRALRERIFKASISRGNNGNDYDNKAVIAQIVALRARRAALLGYPNHAAYVLADETARTTDAVNGMLGRLAPAAVANARREIADMQKLIDRQHGGFALAAWDWAYYAEKVRKARYDFDEAQMKPYLEMDSVLQNGVFYAAHRLYGLDFKERKDLPVYHPDVRVFEVFNEDGSPLGLFLFDPFKRDAKRGGAWMNEFVSQSALFGSKPVVVNNLNIPKPSAGQPVLMTFDEVTTMFHEFGHALHGLFSNVKYPMFAGTSVPRDFVEYPSQVNEMWATDAEVLKHYARHYKTGVTMPKALVDKVLATQKFNQGFATTEYLAAALLDQRWYQLPPERAEVADVNAFEAAALHDAGVDLPQVPPRYRSTYFAHVFSGGYDAGYYAYIWSEVLDADTVKWFEENGGLQRANGDRFRAALLSRGGSEEAMTLFRNFRGRAPDIAPLLERRGLTLPKAP
ncbi:M3 family metallopeptidase [Solimonas flava]|uniref:M3 family metallopeptidase n=1 Tax=Solimonas flava TaxID=415849 RepID=UPI00040276BC|nr:M3 family metallopeptidase [Solimonas flava]